VSDTLDVREVVARFALLMEQKLRENDHKGGWDGDYPDALMERLRQEADELDRVLRRGDNPITSPAGWSDSDCAEVAREAADVANFAMMIADVCGGLPRLPAAGQQEGEGAAPPTTTREGG